MPSVSSVTGGNDESPIVSWITDVVGDPTDMTRNKQIAIGGASGWLTGYISGKVGKIAAVGLGGAILIGVVAVEKGYIKINWSRVNRDLRSVQNTIESEAGRQSSGILRAPEELMNRAKEATRQLEKKLKLKRKLQWKDVQYLVPAFIGGLLLGVGTSRF